MKRIAAVIAAGVMLGATGVALGSGTLTGKFRARITGAPAKQFNGVWTLSFAAGGRYTISESSQVLIVGKATFKASTITFGHESGPAACKGSQARGTYSFLLEGKTLTLHAVADTCTGRRFVLARPFTKVG